MMGSGLHIRKKLKGEVDRIIAPKYGHILISVISECYLTWQKKMQM